MRNYNVDMEAWYARASVWMLLSAAPEALPYLTRQFFPASRREEFAEAVRSADDPAAWFRQFLLAEFCPKLLGGQIKLSSKDAYRGYVFACDLLTGRAAVLRGNGTFIGVRGVRPCEDAAIYPADPVAKLLCARCECRGSLPKRWRQLAKALRQAYPQLF